MATVYWLTETGEAEPQPVCTVDFADEGTAVDFAHQLYRSVHGFARSRQGFVIRGEEGEALYTWQWTGEPHNDQAADAPEAGRPAPAAAAREEAPPLVRPRALHRLDRPYPDLHRMLRSRLLQYRQAASELIRRTRASVDDTPPLRWPSRLRDEVSRLLRACAARFRAVGKRLPAVWRRLTRWERPIRPADPKRFPPDVRPKVRRWRPEIDHYLLAIIVALGVLCGSPLASIYSTVQRFTRDDAVIRRDGSAAAAATRDAAKSTLSTDGKLDFRKLFWHLRVMGPTEIHLLAYDPADGDGPRMIFETRDLVRWRLHSVRGADGTWWAKAASRQHTS